MKINLGRMKTSEIKDFKFYMISNKESSVIAIVIASEINHGTNKGHFTLLKLLNDNVSEISTDLKKLLCRVPVELSLKYIVREVKDLSGVNLSCHDRIIKVNANFFQKQVRNTLPKNISTWYGICSEQINANTVTIQWKDETRSVFNLDYRPLLIPNLLSKDCKWTDVKDF